MNILLAMVFIFGSQETDTLKTKRLEEVTITASRGDVNTPISETTIQTEKLDINYNGQEMPVILATTPSITWYSDGGHYNGYAYYRLRGIDQTRINVTLNGIPLNEPEDQGVYFSNYPDFVNSLKSIQIQRGVGLSTNGTASFAGSVNLQAPSLTDSICQAQLTVGSFNTQRASFEYGSGLLNRFAFYGRISNVRTDGFRNNSGTNGTSAFLNGGYFGKKSLIKFVGFAGTSKNDMAYLAASKTDLDNDYKINYLRDDEKDKFFQTLLSLDYTLNISEHKFLTATVYYNKLVGNYDVYYDPDMLNFQLNSNWIGAFVNYHYEYQNIKIIGGVHVNSYNRNHEMAIKPDTDVDLYSNTGYKKEFTSFIRGSYTINKLVANVDLQDRNVSFRYEPDAASSDLVFDEKTWNFINPKIGLTYNLNNMNRVYTSIGITNREPTRNDMFAGYDNIDHVSYGDVGKLDKVKPERVTDFELGYNITKSFIDFDANIYYMKFKNEIAAIGRLSYIGLPLRKNVESSYRTGLELSMDIRPIKFINKDCG
ncbi:MAG: TonB-dependent receptor [Richelia sp. RM2_1_2]|nr:TonB-dependent receptor [Richelia sp. RM2_1_2]